MSDFETRLLTELTNLDAARPVAERVPRRPRWRKPAFVVGAVVAALAAGAATAAAAGVFSGPRDFVVATEQVAPGGTMAVKGLGCAGGVPVAISFDDKALGTLTADDAGAFWGNYPVPSDAALGTHRVAAVCDPGGAGQPIQQTTVTVAILPPPSPPAPELVVAGKAIAGGEFVVKGAGCAAGATVTVAVDGIDAGTATADDMGIYTGAFSLPDGVSVGDHEVRATCAGRVGAALVRTTILSVVSIADANPTKPSPTK